MCSSDLKRVLVIHPGIDDQPAAAVVAEEQAEASEELGAEPMPIGAAERGTLPVFRPAWILGNGLKHQLGESRQQLDVGVGWIVLGRGLAGPLASANQILQLTDQRLMEEQRPAVDDHA